MAILVKFEGLAVLGPLQKYLQSSRADLLDSACPGCSGSLPAWLAAAQPRWSLQQLLRHLLSFLNVTFPS